MRPNIVGWKYLKKGGMVFVEFCAEVLEEGRIGLF
jgi:hypothetical protein